MKKELVRLALTVATATAAYVVTATLTNAVILVAAQSASKLLPTQKAV